MIDKKFKEYTLPTWRIYSRMPIHIHKKLNILRNFKTKEDAKGSQIPAHFIHIHFNISVLP